jgi:hypothetical protein
MPDFEHKTLTKKTAVCSTARKTENLTAIFEPIV